MDGLMLGGMDGCLRVGKVAGRKAAKPARQAFKLVNK